MSKNQNEVNNLNPAALASEAANVRQFKISAKSLGIKSPLSFQLADIAIISMLTALYIVLSRFLSINTQVVKIGFSFLPVAIAAYFSGIVGAAVVSGLGDLLGALLFPFGPFFPGYTVTAVLLGIIFGAAFYREYRFRNTVLAVVTTQILCTLFLNTLWTTLLYAKKGFWAYLLTRLPQSLIMTAVQILLIHLVLTAIEQAPALKKIKKLYE